MFPASDNFYAQWRLRARAANALRDGRDVPPERLLQTIWQYQRLRRDQLRTLDGQTVRVLHPGFGNVEGGPDFRNALVQFGEDKPRSGDVEIDLRPSGWRAHGHDRNRAFQNVILHVVWETDRSAAGDLPILPLYQSLDASLAELSLWLEDEPVQALPAAFQGKCSAPLRELSDSRLKELLDAAAQTRLQAKAAQFQARARHAGWEQALWEGLFRALGYKHNVWPMQCLAETRRRWQRGADSVFTLQVRLLGIAGLLPADLSRPTNEVSLYIRRAWDCWWRERDEFEDCVLPRTAWRRHGLRPANHPQRRLALAAHWLVADNLIPRLERWCGDDLKENQLLPSLTEILQVARDEFWSWRWTLRSRRFGKSQPLLGEKRATDLAVNVILPWLWTRAHEGRKTRLQREIERRYFAWPAAEDNAVLRLARQRLLGGTSRNVARGAAAQQGLMQIVRDFCDHSNAVCENCQFPGLVRQFVVE